jgi:poly-gamma-glutamate capsule biosynthesis protein CapA/YwtB (metallophosphatase superfamily)
MRNTNKIVFLALVILAFSGCAKNTSLTKNNNNTLEQAAPIQADDIQNKKQIKILFVGDMMFDRYIREGVKKYGGGDYDYIFGQVKDRLAGYDLVVGNLEGPITDKSSVSVGTAMDEKKNLVFTFDPAVAKTLAENNIKLVDLGNNHILNQGEDGIIQTKKYLDEAGVQYFGDTGADESSTLVKVIGGTKIGFVNYNYSITGSFEKTIKDIENLKTKSDIVVVCPHWGTEYKVGDPGQNIRAEAYQLIDAGADAIIGGHPHVIEDSEIYKNKKIYYSLGNFIFDQYFQKETMEGLGVELIVSPDLSMEFNELKFDMTKKGQTIFKVEP